jgi:hypothetical protein
MAASLSGGDQRHPFRRAALAGASAFVAVNIWTGAPLLALWVGSHLVNQTSLSMRGVAIVLVVLAVAVFTLTYLLGWLNRSYLDLVHDARAGQRRPRIGYEEAQVQSWRDRWATLTAVERIVVLSVYLAVLTFFLWFVFLAGSPIPQ